MCHLPSYFEIAHSDLYPCSNRQTLLGTSLSVLVGTQDLFSHVSLSLDLQEQTSNKAQDPSGNLIKNQIWLSESIFTQWVSQMVVFSPGFCKELCTQLPGLSFHSIFACYNGTQIFTGADGLLQSKHLMKDINILKDVWSLALDSVILPN